MTWDSKATQHDNERSIGMGPDDSRGTSYVQEDSSRVKRFLA